MPILIPTHDNGATTKPHEGMYVHPGREMTDADLHASVDVPDGMNGAFIADVLSGMLTHERCGRHLYRSVAERTNNPMLKRRYEEFGEETERHAEVLEQLITAMGGRPAYVSPTARAVQGMDTKTLESTFLLSGSVDVMTQEVAMLDAVFLAESMDHANWDLLARLAEAMPDGETKQLVEAAVAEVAPDEDQHLLWAKETKARMVQLQASSSIAAAGVMKAEEMVATVRSWFSD
jgi:rubrerythrin